MTTPPAQPSPPPSWQEPLPKDETADRPAETGKAWEAFCWYRDLGPSRSLDKVERKYNKSRPLLARWSGIYHWVTRVQAYDVHQAEQARKAAEEQHAALITAYRERAAKAGAAMAGVGTGFLVKAGQRLQSLEVETIPISSLPAFMRAAAALTQAALTVEAEALGISALEDLINTNEDEGSAES